MKLAIFWIPQVLLFHSLVLWKLTQCFVSREVAKGANLRREISNFLDGSSLGKKIIQKLHLLFLNKEKCRNLSIKKQPHAAIQTTSLPGPWYLFSKKVVRISERREIPKRHGANVINSVHMADCLWISSHELRGRESRTDPAIVLSQYVCTLIPVPGEPGAAASLTHHMELVGECYGMAARHSTHRARRFIALFDSLLFTNWAWHIWELESSTWHLTGEQTLGRRLEVGEESWGKWLLSE